MEQRGYYYPYTPHYHSYGYSIYDEKRKNIGLILMFLGVASFVFTLTPFPRIMIPSQSIAGGLLCCISGFVISIIIFALGLYLYYPNRGTYGPPILPQPPFYPYPYPPPYYHPQPHQPVNEYDEIIKNESHNRMKRN